MISEQAYRELARFRDSPVPFETPPSERLCLLHDSGMLRLITCRWSEDDDGVKVSYLKNVGVITELGRDSLAEFEHVRHKETEDERQKRFQNKISVAQVLVPLITFLVGLFVEYYSGVVSFFAPLFQR